MQPPSPPVDAEAYRLMRAGRLLEALPLAERAVADARACVPGHGFLATILAHLGRGRDAERVVSRAMMLATGSAEAYDGLAYVALLLGRHRHANDLYRRAAHLAPSNPRHHYNLACSERSLGRLEAAEAACDRCIALDAAQYAAFLLRSELRVQSPGANHIAELEARLGATQGDARARAHIGYALAKELDDVRRFDAAFEHFAAAAAARRSQITYDIADDERRLGRIAEVFPREASVAASASASAGAGCIFIVGLPRSGTTLVERILGGLPGVRSNGETDNFSRALTLAAGSTGDMFERAAVADVRAVAAAYARLAGLGAAHGAVIDKLPTNYLYLGAIRRALPHARLVLVTRTPLDSCFAMFRTLFGEAFPFTYDFEELARYHAAYERLMRHWRAVLGDALHEILYEDLVHDPGAVGERLARHCGLAWTEAALDIQSNQSVSLTASAAQVRRPIYGTSSGRWRHYRRHLAPLIAALRRNASAVPADADADVSGA